jgi:hypothetical protein
MGETVADGVVRVTAILFMRPTPWTPDWWAPHPWDWVEDEMPLERKPVAELEVPLQATLGEVVEAALDGWGIRRGADDELREWPLYDQAYWMAFADPTDEHEFDRWDDWTPNLPVALPDGSVEERRWAKVTYQQLLVAAELGMVRGDATRPYVRLVFPQGNAIAVVQGARATAEAIRAAYNAFPVVLEAAERGIQLIRVTVPSGRHITDDAMRGWFWVEILRRLRRRWRKTDD